MCMASSFFAISRKATPFQAILLYRGLPLINKTTAVWENSGGAGVALGEMSVRGEFTTLRVQNKGNPVDYKKKYNARVSRALFFSS